jgi:hypothetical protein
MKVKATKTAMLAMAGAVVLSLLSGCAWSIGGQKEAAVTARPTAGQELVDLKKARDQGAITEEEYQAKKQRIMEK